MENIDKGLNVQNGCILVRPKIPQMPQNLSTQLPTSSGFQRKNGFIGSPESVVRGPNSTQTNLAVFKKFWLKHSAKSAVIKL